MTTDPGELDALRERFRAALATGRMTIYPPLPRLTRLRLGLTYHIDGTAIWLVNHGHIEAAVRLWRICGMW